MYCEAVTMFKYIMTLIQIMTRAIREVLIQILNSGSSCMRTETYMQMRYLKWMNLQCNEIYIHVELIRFRA